MSFCAWFESGDICECSREVAADSCQVVSTILQKELAQSSALRVRIPVSTCHWIMKQIWAREGADQPLDPFSY